jgi:hypothetical protein
MRIEPSLLITFEGLPNTRNYIATANADRGTRNVGRLRPAVTARKSIAITEGQEWGRGVAIALPMNPQCAYGAHHG